MNPIFQSIFDQHFPKLNLCAFPGCGERSVASCDCCPESRRFCRDHGTPSRDVETPGYAPVAHPAACWQCGGYNADG